MPASANRCARIIGGNIVTLDLVDIIALEGLAMQLLILGFTDLGVIARPVH